MSERRFYIYRWIRSDTGLPFYIGRGTGYRAYTVSSAQRSTYFMRILNKTDCYVEILMRGLTKEEAVEKEIYFIKLHRDCGIRLCNLTEGGAGGMPGHHHSPETLKRMSEAQRGHNHPMFGRKHTAEAKAKISQAVRGPNNPYYGKKHSLETRQKMSASNRGSRKRPQTAEHIAKRMESAKRNRELKRALIRDDLTSTATS